MLVSPPELEPPAADEVPPTPPLLAVPGLSAGALSQATTDNAQALDINATQVLVSPE